MELESEIPIVEEGPTGPSGHPALAWTIIVALVGVLFALRSLAGVRPPVPAAPTEPAEDAAQLLVRLQGRYLVGAGALVPDKSKLVEQARALDAGPVSQRLRYVALVGELEGPEAARKALGDLTKGPDRTSMTAEERRVALALRRLYRDYARGKLDAPTLKEADRELLRSRLGWFGELALTPAGGPDPAAREQLLGAAHRTAATIIVAVVGAAGLGVLGIIGLTLFLILFASGQIRGGLGGALPHGGVYAEAFAAWMLLYLVFSIIAESALEGPGRLAVQGVAMLLSLVAVGWPVVRGVPWDEVRRDVGLTWGRQPGLEPVLGVVGYVLTVPVLAVGLCVTLVLMHVAAAETDAEANADRPAAVENKDAGARPERDAKPVAAEKAGDVTPPIPTHPILGSVPGGGWWNRLLILLLACVAAPIVEETMFRGLLYRQLRSSTGLWPRWLGVAFSATVVSFLFAIVHPQGPLAVPALMSLAYGLVALREWRGTLVPGIVMHALNNGLLMALFMLAMAD